LNLRTKITSSILLALTLLMFVFGWFSMLDEKTVLQEILAKHGKALAKVVSDFSVDLLLLEDYPVLESVLKSFARREDNVLSIEVTHNGRTVASYSKGKAESGVLFVSPVEFHAPQANVRAYFGEVRLRLSEADNENIIAARQQEILLHTLVAFIILLLIISLILRKVVLKRINELTCRMESVLTDIGIHTDTKPACGESGPCGDELDVLGFRFDEMVSNVRNHNAALKNEVTRRTLDLQEAKEVAERSNIAKSRFLAAASHDLRQPLQALSLYTGALEFKVKDPDIAAIVNSLSSGIQVMRDMLNTLLDVSRLDAGVIVPEVHQLAISDIFAALGNEFQDIAHEKGILLRICKSSLQTESDPVLLGRILRNLISNAVHYTEQGRVLVGCRRYGSMFRIEVYDTGIGISADQLDEIFEDFHQIGNVARNRRLGLGLGLAIAKGMADLLGHQLSVNSLPGKGSCFSIELPMISKIQAIADEDDARQTKTGQQGCILVIDDEQDIVDSLRTLLEVYGYQVIAALSERQALQILQTHPMQPDLIIADYRLSDGENGSDAIIEVGKVCGKKIPGILLTGDTDPDRISSANRSGFSLLHKPVDTEMLITTIHEHISKSNGH
jgi:signal transduction histidine kinase/CheY-like chemotaxis protein